MRRSGKFEGGTTPHLRGEGVGERCVGEGGAPLQLLDLPLVALPIDGKVPQALARPLEQGILVDERCGHDPRLELQVGQHVEEERYVGRQPPYVALDHHTRGR